MKFGLLGHAFDSANLGVVAQAMANLALIREAAEHTDVAAQFLLIGGPAQRPLPAALGPLDYEVLDTGQHRLANASYRLLQAIRQCDLVFDLGEGDHFSDLFGRSSLARRLLAQAMVLGCHVPLVFCPQSFGPFHSDWAARAARQTLKRAACIFTRETASLAQLRALGIEQAELATDVAIDLPYRLHPSRPGGLQRNIGLSVSALLYHGHYQGSANHFELACQYERLNARLIEALLASGAQVHLLAHAHDLQAPADDDYALAERLHDKYPALILAPRFDDPVQAKSYIAGLDALVGARLHATLAAFSSGVPVIPLAYSRSFDSLYRSLDYPHLVDMTHESTNSAVDTVLDLLAQPYRLSADLAHANRIARERLAGYRRALQRLIGERVGQRRALQS